VFLLIPSVTTGLATANSSLLCNNLLLLSAEYFNDKSRESKEKPFDGNPPKSDEKPPYNVVVLVFDFHIGDNVHCYFVASAFRTLHIIILSV
jgi:hypothetical protein